MIKSIDVILWNKKVGTLISSTQGYKENIYFYYDSNFLKTGLDIAPLRASIHSIGAQRGLPIFSETDKKFGGLPSFISDSMPDYWGNIIFDKWAKANNIKKKDLNALDRLAYIGARGMGALEFIPSVAPEFEKSFKVEIAQLSDLAKLAINKAHEFHTQLGPSFAIETLFKVGTSAGGRRPKAVININLDTKECFSGQINTPMDGVVPMIIKFDEHNGTPSTRIEFSYYLMAKEVSLNMMPSYLYECNNEAHFLTERFDRKDNQKIHVQTLAAMNPDSSSYEELFEVAKKLNCNDTEIKQLFLQMVMNVVSGNVDDHNKNFSFTMESDGEWHVAPTYDYTFTIDPSAPFYVNRHSMTINGKVEAISRKDLLAIAELFSIKNANYLINNAIDIAKRYEEFATQAGVPSNWIMIIKEEIDKRINNLYSGEEEE